ncbi:MAG: Adenine deaminase C-terminal domain, partial [Anaerocolumna sp.]|nr:Adenine deaminase C-terminal domain [Anaerocolumna sp.]
GIDPFMTLAFLSLSVIPELRLTSRGLLDVRMQEFKNTFFD